MSRRSAYLLQKVENEYLSSLSAIAFTNRFWHYQDRLLATDAESLQQLKKKSLQQFNTPYLRKRLRLFFLFACSLSLKAF